MVIHFSINPSGVNTIHFLNFKADSFRLGECQLSLVVRKEICEHISDQCSGIPEFCLERCRGVAGIATRLNNCEGSDVKTKHL